MFTIDSIDDFLLIKTMDRCIAYVFLISKKHTLPVHLFQKRRTFFPKRNNAANRRTDEELFKFHESLNNFLLCKEQQATQSPQAGQNDRAAMDYQLACRLMVSKHICKPNVF